MKYLDSQVKTQDNAIEQYFCKPFEQAQRMPMDEETSMMMIQLLMIPKDTFKIPDAEKPFLVRVIEGRLSVFSYQITDMRLLLFLAVISETPGTAIMYLTYLQYWCNKQRRTEVDLDTLCEVFPTGFLSEESLTRIWDGQKVGGEGSDNLLDYPAAMNSINPAANENSTAHH